MLAVSTVTLHCISRWLESISVCGITVLCHSRKNDLTHVILCKNDNPVTFYNVIFSNMTCILSHLSYIFY